LGRRKEIDARATKRGVRNEATGMNALRASRQEEAYANNRSKNNVARENDTRVDNQGKVFPEMLG
jgi:hypothetical protein